MWLSVCYNLLDLPYTLPESHHTLCITYVNDDRGLFTLKTEVS